MRKSASTLIVLIMRAVFPLHYFGAYILIGPPWPLHVIKIIIKKYIKKLDYRTCACA